MKVAEAARKEALDEVMTIIFKKMTAIEKIMQNGYPIFAQSSGKRFDKMYEKRQKMWSKHLTLNNMYATIANLKYQK